MLLLHAPSSFGIVRPKNTKGALPHATEPPLPSSHMTLIGAPAALSSADTMRLLKIEPIG